MAIVNPRDRCDRGRIRAPPGRAYSRWGRNATRRPDDGRGPPRRSAEERRDRPAERDAVLDVGQVPDPGEDLEPGPRDRFGEPGGDPGRVHDVELADEHQGRDPELADAV